MLPARARPIGVVIPVALLMTTLPLCGAVLRQQLVQHRLETAMARFDLGKTGPDRLIRTIDETARCGVSCSPEIRLLLATAQADAAVKARTGSDRQRLLASAARSADLAASARPHWGPAMVAEAAIADLGTDDGRAVRYFQRSYADAPYLREQSLWRLRFGAANWARLDGRTRRAMMREASWLTRMGPNDRAKAIAALGDTPAGAHFALMLLSASDAAVPPGQGR